MGLKKKSVHEDAQQIETISHSIHPSLHPILPSPNRQLPPRGVLQLEGSQSLVAFCEVSLQQHATTCSAHAFCFASSYARETQQIGD